MPELAWGEPEIVSRVPDGFLPRPGQICCAQPLPLQGSSCTCAKRYSSPRDIDPPRPSRQAARPMGRLPLFAPRLTTGASTPQNRQRNLLAVRKTNRRDRTQGASHAGQV
ncbi:protein of unknown function [Cupriavidus taiwanensis]|uniref:Uncharacterized protein n=1 Tax=Cupriavidus taiwanensis TaxID=164546 RepID=A0A7Z7J869_9BURK|nr:protein of unknown function [Cupriavidus taiwanensis]SOZ05673.1 hypothetical protein CBM2595_A80358 [Cupriavidus taiwanensis]SOZ07657.1 hypothetical protein CBM2597_A90263 [Cupriavidus taiwanensis]SPC15694.1 hypothetical protein CBM2594_A70259 [Cupriavidus taiwanensis]SPD40351.1 protein of unknown function [Cupriavidus taiwanensis]